MVEQQQFCTLIRQDVVVYERQLLDGEAVIERERKTEAHVPVATSQLKLCGVIPASDTDVILTASDHPALVGKTDRNGEILGDIQVLLGEVLERDVLAGRAWLSVGGIQVGEVPLDEYREEQRQLARQRELIAEQLEGEALLHIHAGRAETDPIRRQGEFSEAHRLLEGRRAFTSTPSRVDGAELARLRAEADREVSIIAERQPRAAEIAAEKQRTIERRESAARGARESREAWGDSPLLCRDGTLSPSCTCGGRRRGCCSHHHGVAGCSASR